MVSWQKGPTRHAYAWQIGPFWQDTLNMSNHIYSFLWDVFTHPYPTLKNSYYTTIKVKVSKSNYIPPFYMGTLTYLCNKSLLIKQAPEVIT